MPKELKWYIIRAHSGYEEKVKEDIEARIREKGQQDNFDKICVPQEEIVTRNGESRSRRYFPGYLLVRISISDEIFHIIKNTPKVTGFVGAGGQPSPLTDEQAHQFLNPPSVEHREERDPSYEPGGRVKVIDGPFKDFEGTIKSVDNEKKKLTVEVSIFGRKTPVELGFDQVEPL